MSQTRKLLAAIDAVQAWLDQANTAVPDPSPFRQQLPLLIQAADEHAQILAVDELDALPRDAVLVFPAIADPDVAKQQEVYTKGSDGYWLWAGSAELHATTDLPWRRPFVVMFDPSRDRVER